MSSIAFIGIGSNLGSAKENCEQAIIHLQKCSSISLLAQSSYYKTAPVGVTDQDWFVNSVAKISTTSDPHKLLEQLLSIEKEMGRIPRKKWGPREIDLDLLYFDQQIICTETLNIPHPEIPNRRFVLEPLNELDPEGIHPQLNKSNREMLADLPQGQETILIK